MSEPIKTIKSSPFLNGYFSSLVAGKFGIVNPDSMTYPYFDTIGLPSTYGCLALRKVEKEHEFRYDPTVSNESTYINDSK